MRTDVQAPEIRKYYIPHRALRVERRRRRRRRRVLLLGIALLVGLVIVGIWAHPRSHRSPVKSQPLVYHAEPYKPSFLRSGAPWLPAEIHRLDETVRPIINDDAFPAATSLVIADARNGRVLYQHASRAPLTPGSTIKLVVAAAALDMLGANYRFTTSIVSDATPASGVLDGNIWLIGGGDPELTTDDLRRGSHEVGLRGIGSITGNVYADGSLFGNDEVNSTWLADDLIYGWAAPASAISIDGGSIQFTVTPQAGSEAGVSVDPPGAAQRVVASVSTVASDAANTLRIDALPNDSGYEISGQIPYGAPQKYWRAIAHPTKAAATSLLEILRLSGITVYGGALTGKAPVTRNVLWQHRSRPLYQIVQRMFFDSDNHIAEELLRSLGAEEFGVGTLQQSVAAERHFLRGHEIPTGGLNIADGSGLSSADRVTAQSLVDVLYLIAHHVPPDQPFKLLPRAGIEGTVSVRTLSPQALGRVYAKDGYIDGASGLAGYVLTAHHGPLIFAFLVDDWQRGLDAVWDGEDRILDNLATQ